MRPTKYKIILLGDIEVGKTCILTRFSDQNYEEHAPNIIPTVGVDFLNKVVRRGEQLIRLEMWDTAGQERFRSLIPNYIRDVDGCILVLDASNRRTVDGLQKWIDLVREIRGEGAKIIVAVNKTDLPCDKNTTGAAREIAQQNGLDIMEVSARTNKNIDRLFMDLVETIWVSKPAVF